ncbi:MAG: hypothetical protein ACK5YV_16710 [Betaproteobacteria bacterium]|jgi:hypothetical protein
MQHEVTTNADGSTTFSVNLADMSLEQLVQVSQGLGRQIDKLRERRAYLRAKIDARLAAGERTSVEAARSDASGDATAPGAAIEAMAR